MQLRAVLVMLLAELPSNLPVLFLATAKVPQGELDEQVASLFGSSMYVFFSFPSQDQFDVRINLSTFWEISNACYISLLARDVLMVLHSIGQQNSLMYFD